MNVVREPSDGADEAVREARFARGRQMLLVAIGVIAAGLALTGSFQKEVGGAFLLAGWILALYALHRLGRSGPA